MKKEAVFETERLTFRRMTEENLPDLMEMFQDPEVMRFYEHTYNEAEGRAWLQKILESYEKNGAGLWACYLKETGEFVGQCGLLFRPNFHGRDEVEVGYMFRQAFWGRGLATEAAAGAMRYAREQLGKGRLISLIRPGNTASIRVAEKNGLVAEKVVEHKGAPIVVYVLS